MPLTALTRGKTSWPDSGTGFTEKGVDSEPGRIAGTTEMPFFYASGGAASIVLEVTCPVLPSGGWCHAMRACAAIRLTMPWRALKSLVLVKYRQRPLG